MGNGAFGRRGHQPARSIGKRLAGAPAACAWLWGAWARADHLPVSGGILSGRPCFWWHLAAIIISAFRDQRAAASAIRTAFSARPIWASGRGSVRNAVAAAGQQRVPLCRAGIPRHGRTRGEWSDPRVRRAHGGAGGGASAAAGDFTAAAQQQGAAQGCVPPGQALAGVPGQQ